MFIDNPTFIDSYGVVFSQDGANLISCPKDYFGEYLIPEGIIDVNRDAFNGCTFLCSVIFPQSLSCISAYAFYNCDSLTSLEIPDGVEYIDEFAFFGCKELRHVIFPRGLLKIGTEAFSSSYKIERVVIPNGCALSYDYYYSFITSFNSATEVWRENAENARLTSDSPEDFIGYTQGDREFFVNCEGVILTSDRKRFYHLPIRHSGEYFVPDGVEVINGRAFAQCRNITCIRFPNSLTSIHEKAFEDCENLLSVDIPDSVTEIGNDAFCGCENLSRVIVSDDLDMSLQWFYYATSIVRRSEENARIMAIFDSVAAKGIVAVGMPARQK